MKHFKTAVTIISAALIISGTMVASEEKKNAIAKPTMPTIPTVVTPSIGGEFYTPSAQGFYSGGIKKPTPPTKPSQPNNQTKNSTSKTETLNRVLTDEMKKQLNDELMNGGIGLINKNSTVNQNDSKEITNRLTANDLANLENLGLFGSLSNLLSNSKNNTLGQVSTESKNSETLEQILNELTELKSNVTPNAKSVSFSNQPKSDPKILRFIANNADYMRTVKSVYFSKEEADGTFLLTGDLKYSVGGRSHSETFYILFKSAGVEMGTTKYSVSASVSQDSEFNSFLKRLSNLSETSKIEATRIGNLVTMRVNESDLKMDVLLALDN